MSKNFQALCALQAIMGREENALEVLTNDYFTNNNRRVYATALATTSFSIIPKM